MLGSHTELVAVQLGHRQATVGAGSAGADRHLAAFVVTFFHHVDNRVPDRQVAGTEEANGELLARLQLQLCLRDAGQNFHCDGFGR